MDDFAVVVVLELGVDARGVGLALGLQMGLSKPASFQMGELGMKGGGELGIMIEEERVKTQPPSLIPS